MNKWIGSGRLTENPVIRYNADKVSFVTFTVMCKRNKRIREGDQPVDFIDCICFGNIARLARDHLYKDKKVEIIGPLQSGHYTTKDGQKVYTKTVKVAERAIRAADHTPHEISELVDVIKKISAAYGYDIDGRIAFQDKKTKIIYK